MSPAKTPEGLAALERHKVVSVDEIRRFEGNARRGDVDLIRESLREHGQYQPLIVWRQTGEILVGNHTYQAALEEGWTRVAVVYRDVADRETAAKIVAIDNRSSDQATYDKVELAALLQTAGGPTGDLTGTGFSAGDLEHLLEPQTIEPPAPETPAKARTRPGDVVELGRHRLVCGDARDGKAYAQALGESRADVVITDPPYGVEIHELANMRAERGHAQMAGDGIDDPALEELHRTALEHARANARKGAAIYLFHADTAGELERRAFREAGWRTSATLIWRKNTIVVGRQDYQWRHEPILYGWKPGAGHRWFGGHDKATILGRDPDLEAMGEAELRELAGQLIEATPDTILDYAKPHRSVEHPTMKPVELVAKLLLNSSEQGDTLLDPFAGSGTAILAAEQLDRTAAAIELEPGYCDVAAARYEELTGDKPRWPRRRRSSK